MPITYQNAGRNGVAAGTCTLSFDVGSSDDRILLVATLGSNAQVTSCTYNGVAMTDSGLSHTGAFGGGAYYVKFWYLMNPDSGANDIVASGGASSIGIDAACFNGVDQSDPFNDEAVEVKAGTRRYQSQDIDCLNGGWAVAHWMGDGTATLQAETANTTIRTTGNSGAWGDRGQDTDAAATETISAGNTTVADSTWAVIWFSLNVASGGGGTTFVPTPTLLTLNAG